jgi:nicotinamide-nucleotide amidase
MSVKPARELKDVLLAIDKTICVAESLTGGHLQAMITSVSGSSDYFDGGVTAYNVDQKVKLLGVDREHAAAVNCVSQRVADEMATGVRKLFGSFVGLATTGYAEAWPAGDVAAPFAFYAVNIGGWTTGGRVDGGDRSRFAVQQFVADTVLRHLIESFGRLVQTETAPEGLEAIQRQLRDRAIV